MRKIVKDSEMKRNVNENEEDMSALSVAQKPVRLRVGGRVFETTAETLCAHEDSMLAALVLRWKNQQQSNGSMNDVFIDRDGDTFADVLNYLRNGVVCTEDLESLRKLRTEAEFFCLDGLRLLCDDELERIESNRMEEWRLVEEARDEEIRRIKKKFEDLEHKMNSFFGVLCHKAPVITRWRCAADEDEHYELPVFRTDVDF